MNDLMDLRGKVDVLHNVVGDTTEVRFGKSGSSSNVEEVGLLACQPVIEIINEELKVPILRFFMEYWEAQISHKIVGRGHLKNVKNVLFEFILG